MTKSPAQLRKDCQATVKLVLTELEQAGAQSPAEARVSFAERRSRVIRGVWMLFTGTLDHDQGVQAPRGSGGEQRAAPAPNQ